VRLEDRLSLVLRREFDLLQELRGARTDVATARSAVQMRIAEHEQHERDAQEHYEAAAAADEPEAEALRGWSERSRRRIEELRASADELAAAEERVLERIEAMERDIEDFRLLQPQLVASVAVARSAGVGREVFDTLNDALNYVGLALDAVAGEDPNGPLRDDPEES
jgi:hypothetical protein